jgi:signal transduction histidine kinase
MIIASILLSKANSFFWALFSSCLLITTASLEYTGKIDHHPILFQLTGISLWNNLYWNIFILSAFCFTLLCVVYMTSSIATRLKQRNEEIIGLEKEIADRKIQDTKKQLFFSEKMASLGKLAAGMAHEINNPLTTILSYSECLEDELKKNPSHHNDIKTIISETIRIRGIVKQVLNFARAGDQIEAEPVNLNDISLEIVDMLQSQMDFRNVLFTLNLGKDLPPAKVGKEHLTQVLLNMMVNASQAMEGKGTIIIETLFRKEPGILQIKCTDTGPGISPENVSKIFDPFFTTKRQGKGSGLGLSVSYGLIKMYEGDITVKSKKGEGTTFTISLPTAPAAK